MKKYLLALCAILGIFTAAQAQRTELTVSYGGYTQMDAMDCHDGGHDVNTAWGALNVGVNFNVAPNFWIGPSYTFSSTTRKNNSATSRMLASSASVHKVCFRSDSSLICNTLYCRFKADCLATRLFCVNSGRESEKLLNERA